MELTSTGGRKGATTFVLIPGAGGSAWYWHLVVPVLEYAGHETIAVDIPQDDPSLGLPEYADAVEQAIGDRKDVVLVAQSMGAFTAPMVATRTPVRLMALVNAMVPLPGETPGPRREARSSADRMAAGWPVLSHHCGFDPVTHFLHDVPNEVLEDAPDPRGPADTPFGQTCDFPGWDAIPVRSLIGTGDRFFPPDFQRQLARERVGIVPDELPGGHLIALSNPRGVARWLLNVAAPN